MNDETQSELEDSWWNVWYFSEIYNGIQGRQIEK